MPIAKKQPLKPLTIYQSPVRLLVVTFFSVFAAEVFIMFFLSFLQPISIRMWAFLDAILLILLLSPALYFFGFRPLILHVNERKRAEKAIEQLRRQNELIMEAAGEGIFGLDLEGRVIFVNPAAARRLGYEVEELVGEVHHSKVHHLKPDRTPYPTEECLITAAYKDGLVHRGEDEVFWKKDGTSIPIEYVSTPIREGEKLIGAVVVFKDITERKQAEEEAQALKQQMEFILGVTKTGLDIIDSDFNIRFIDTEWQKVYGDPTGRKCYEYFMGRSEVCPGCGIPKALETKTFTVTEEVLVKEGNRPIQVTTLPFQNKEGEWLVAEVNVDITERKRMEEKLLYLSTHDVLTGLYNRTHFDEEMAKLERGRQFPLSILMVDVDELKTVNDKQGHAAGDELLRRTAQVLGAAVRVEDVVARIGGDEFAALLIGADVSAAEKCLMRVKKSLEIHNSNYNGLSLSLSLGIATGSKGCLLTKVMQEADAYMYQEKRLRVDKAYRNTS
jgi:diguanylate cyclase (GGDEF)-like protein/PAS domain S-box-containing protein